MGPTVPASEDIHQKKYRMTGESFRDAMSRVASALRDDGQHYYAFREALLDMRFLPAGRIQAAVGANRHVTPYNCYLSGTIADNFTGDDGIMARATEAASTMRMGGGIGYDFSTLRPRNEIIRSLQSRASGPVSFMGIFDSVCRTIASAGHRRGAQMAVLRCDHPDIEEFVLAKQSQNHAPTLWALAEELAGKNDPRLDSVIRELQSTNSLTGFNISVGVTDEFMKAVTEGKEFDLKWEGRIYKTVDARTLWEQVMRSTWDYAEPGVLFIDQINRMNNLWYCEKIAATNPCVTGNTYVITESGQRKIKDLVGRSVRIWNGQQWSWVVPKITGYGAELVEVELSNGLKVTCTPYHKFVTRDGKRKEARELREGQQLFKWDYPIISAGERVANAYTQGFYSGDGWQDKRDGRCYIDLHGAKKNVLERLEVVSWNENLIHGGFEGTNLEETRYRCYVGTSLRPKDFVPDCSWSVESRVQWFEGFSDADGNLAGKSPEGQNLQLYSIDKNFLMEVQFMLQTLGVYSHLAISKTREPNLYVLGVPAFYVTQLKKLGFNPERLDVSRIDTRADRKQFPKVVSVKNKKQKETVYCFNEPIRHTGVFNGIMTGQCGEQPLPPYGACLLGSFNLTRYVKRNLNYHPLFSKSEFRFEWDQLREDIPHVVRAMDNVVDAARYPLVHQEMEAKNKRRMGLGVAGYANAAEALGLPYGSAAARRFLSEVLSLIANEAYKASALLAKEKGAFPLYSETHYLKGGFIKTLEEETRDLIAKYGIRNSHLTSIAPTGTISLAANNISSGIEPVYSTQVDRAINDANGPRIERLQDYGYRVFETKGKLAEECTIDDHLETLITASKCVDSAVSKTCNVSPATPWEQFKDIYSRAWEGGAKGCTTFNSGGKLLGIFTSVEENEPGNDEDEAALSCRVDFETGRRECD